MSIEIIISALPQALSPTVSLCLLAQLSLESILSYPQTVKPLKGYMLHRKDQRVP